MQSITGESCNVDLIPVYICQMTPLKVWLPTAATVSQMYALITTNTYDLIWDKCTNLAQHTRSNDYFQYKW